MTVGKLHLHQVTEDQCARDTGDQLLGLQSDAWLQQQRVLLMGRLMPFLTHDVAQPLGSICNFAGGLLCKMTNGPLPVQELADTLDSIQNQAIRASNLVKQIRNCTKPQLDERLQVNVNDSIRQSLELAKGFLHSEQVTLHTSLAEGLPSICSSLAHVQQVLLNLLTNAVDAMRPLSSKSRCIEISTVGCDNSVAISIKDSGPQISEDIFNKLGRPFFTTKQSSLGLGLWVCRTIVSDETGELQLRQLPLRGLEAVVRWPI